MLQVGLSCEESMILPPDMNGRAGCEAVAGVGTFVGHEKLELQQGLGGFGLRD